MPSQGSLIVRAYTSEAQIPVMNVIVTVTQGTNGSGELLALRLTDESGRTAPVILPAPDAAESQSPASGRPFTVVDIAAEEPFYQRIVVEGVQVFPDTATIQELQLIPLEQSPERWDEADVFYVPPQNL